MDEFGFANSASTSEATWNLLPKPQTTGIVQHSAALNENLSPAASNSTINLGCEEAHQTTPSLMADSHDNNSSNSHEGWTKRQLTRPPKSPVGNDSAKPEEAATNEKLPVKDGRSSPEANCSICLEKVVNRSFTNGCLHTFCFSCLLQWSKIKAECPLCKQAFRSIIHNVQENHKYDEYHIETPMHPPEFREFRDFMTALEVTFPPFRGGSGVGHPFRYSTTMTADRQRIFYSSATINAGEFIPPAFQRYRSRFYFQSRPNFRNEYRSSVYTRDVWATPLVDVTGRYRECSPEFYRANPAQVHRLAPWLTRELGVLLPPGTASLVLDLIMRNLTRYDIQSPEFRTLVQPHLNQRTSHFIHELWSFARSTFDMAGYDSSVEYEANPSRGVTLVISDDSDSDVLVLSPDRPPLYDPYTSTVPSTSAGVDDDSDDCRVVECVKPRHERTPEIIDLLSDGEDHTVPPPVCEETVETWPNEELDREDLSSVNNACETGDSDYVPSKSKKAKKSKSCKKEESVKRKSSSKKCKHVSNTKSTLSKKGKSKLRRTSSQTLPAMVDELKPYKKRGYLRLFSDDEAGPSSPYKSHLRSNNRSQTSGGPSRHARHIYSSSDEDNKPSHPTQEPSQSSTSHLPTLPSEDEASSCTNKMSRQIVSHCQPLDSERPKRIISSSEFLSSELDINSPQQSCSTDLTYASHWRSLNSGRPQRIADSSEDHRRSSSSQPEPSSSQRSFKSSNATYSDAGSLSNCGISEKKLRHKKSHRFGDDYTESHESHTNQSRSRHESQKRRSSSDRHAHRKHSSRDHTPSLDLSSPSWVIKSGESTEASPATSAHSSSDSNVSKPRLKSIIIARQDLPSTSSFSPVASSSHSSSSHPRKKHKYRPLYREHASTSSDSDW